VVVVVVVVVVVTVVVVVVTVVVVVVVVVPCATVVVVVLVVVVVVVVAASVAPHKPITPGVRVRGPISPTVSDVVKSTRNRKNKQQNFAVTTRFTFTREIVLTVGF